MCFWAGLVVVIAGIAWVALRDRDEPHTPEEVAARWEADHQPSHESEPAPAPEAPPAPPVDAAPAVDVAARQVLDVDAGAPIEITARQLYAAYDANEVSADAKYRGRLLEITGIITKIGKDAFGNPYVEIATQNEFSGVVAAFDSVDAVISLKKGYKLVARCRGAGMALGSPALDDCAVEHVFQWVRQ